MLETFIENLCRHSEKNKFENHDGKLIHVHNLSALYMKSNLFLCCVDYYETEFTRIYMKYPFVVRNYELMSRFGEVKEER